ncbi:MAG: symmetrical bis(5'-nucleosyl)-tetraphosphatase [Pseudomonadales bacterium]|jgi:bis(5'-nucleosyl)-tetraphosphatase (symmetrical)
MATFAIGDIQGCYEEFTMLLDALDFRTDRDHIWLVGDLINRGPDNVGVVRRVMQMGDAAITVLGNHDLHFLAIHRGGHTPNRADTLQDLLDWKNVDEASDWFRHRLMLHRDKALGYVMTHAGLPHIWTLKQASELAREVEEVIRGPGCEHFFREMYGNEPNLWSPDLEGMPRWRVITNYLTRMRLVDQNGAMDFSHKGALQDAPGGLLPWFDLVARKPPKQKILFGHWAALEGNTGHDDIIALDTGCVWGRSLTALRLEDGAFFAAESVKATA